MTQVTPQLAHDIDVENFKGVTFPLWGFPKVDGVRAVRIKEHLTGRSMDPFKNSALVAKFADPMYAGFDGELTINGFLTNDQLQIAIEVGQLTVEDPNATLCSLTTGLTNRAKLRKGETALPDNAVWNLFDWLDDSVIGLMYCERYTALVNYLNGKRPAHVNLLPYTVINNADEARAFIAEQVALGLEGAVFRDPTALHKSGRPGKRDNDFWRYKPASAKDCVITGFEEAEQNNNEAKVNSLGRTERSSHKENKVGKGMIGTFLATDKATGAPIRLGPGSATHEQRIEWFNNPDEIVGWQAEYVSLDTGVKDQPRQARFLRRREKYDLPAKEAA